MKAEFKTSKHGLCLEITATTDADKQQIQEFMRARQTAHKPKLKLLRVSDKETQLKIAHVRLINIPYRNITFKEEQNFINGDEYKYVRALKIKGENEWLCVSNFWEQSMFSYPLKFVIISRNSINNTQVKIIEQFTCSSIGELESRMNKY